MSFFFWLFVLALGMYSLHKGWHKWLRHQTKQPLRADKLPSATQQTQAMSQCQHCGVYFPSREAVVVAQAIYCCSAHATLATQKH